ncbi:MAG TPA: hypothetical protein VGP72_21550 [Planctomycetota bacterium]|jgi:hypothetical protein
MTTLSAEVPAQSIRLRAHFAALLLIVSIAVIEKIYIENARIEPYMTFPQILHDTLRDNPRTLLWPMDVTQQGDIRWTTTGMVFFELLGSAVGYTPAFISICALLSGVAYICGWLAFRSQLFAICLALLMAFGTQFSYAYTNSSCAMYPLQITYLLVNLLAVHCLFARDGRAGAKIIFVVSLLLSAVCWETWLDYGAFLLVLCAFLFGWRKRHKLQSRNQNLFLVATITLTTMVVYLAIRIPAAKLFVQPGREAELLVTYPSPLVAIDDLCSNYITYLFTSLTNFLPPVLTSNSMHCYSAAELVGFQNGYDVPSTHFVPMHYLFMWRYAAGAVLALYLYLLFRVLRAAYQSARPSFVLYAAMLMLVGLGFGTHALIKFRPYNSVPILPYKCLISILGTTILIAFGLMQAHRRLTRRWFGVCITSVACCVLLASFTRPAWQRRMGECMGLYGKASVLQGSWATHGRK